MSLDSTPSTRKTTLRRQANAGNGGSGAERHRLDADLCSRIIDAFPPDTSKSLSFYWPLARECDTRAAAEAWHVAGGLCVLPVITGGKGHPLIFRRWKPDDAMMKSSFGTMEPLASAPVLDPDILLVPLVMADQHGGRLGRGAGHYDATLGPLRQRKKIMAIGVAYDWQLSEDSLPIEDHDQRLDGIVTPTRLLLFP